MDDCSGRCNSSGDERPDDDDDNEPPCSSTLRRGNDANLALYRAALKAFYQLLQELQRQQSSSSSSSSPTMTNIGQSVLAAAAQEAVQNATRQLLASDAEYFLLDRLEAKISIQQQEEEDDEEDDDDESGADEVDGEHQVMSSQPKVLTEMVSGYVMVTSERLIFCAKEASDGAAADLDIAATRIDLHALSSSSSLDDADQQQPPQKPGDSSSSSINGSVQQQQQQPSASAVYVQVQALERGCGDDDYNSPPPLEISIVPQAGQDDDDAAAVSQQCCQQIFDAIAKLVSLHPIDPNHTGDNSRNGGDAANGSGGGGLSAVMMLMMGDGGGIGDNVDHDYFSYGEQDLLDDDDNDEMVWAPAATTTLTTRGDDDDDDADDQRQAMLDRLDNLLVVPPELQLDEDDHENETAVEEIVPGQFDDPDEEEGDNDML
jgi:Regulator of volume decrease after cellular swelling